MEARGEVLELMSRDGRINAEQKAVLATRYDEAAKKLLRISTIPAGTDSYQTIATTEFSPDEMRMADYQQGKHKPTPALKKTTSSAASLRANRRFQNRRRRN